MTRIFLFWGEPVTNVKPDFIDTARKLEVKRIFECGSRDALDGIELARSLDAEELHIFECNPAAIDLCSRNLERFSGRTSVCLNPVAVADKEEELDFYSIDPSKTVTSWKDGNIGASSLYQVNPEWPYERLVQNKIRVRSISLNSYCKDHPVPDLLWIDVQGAEMRLLQGAGEILPSVKLIHIEVSFRPLYLGQPLFWDVDRLLRKQFKLVKLYDIRFRWLLKLNTFLGREKWFTDAVYVNRRLAG